MTKVLIADKNYLSRIGLELLINDLKGFVLCDALSGDISELNKKIDEFRPDLLIIDHFSLSFSNAELKQITKKNKELKVLAITVPLRKDEMKATLNSGVTSYLLKDCDKEEIIEAIHSTLIDQRFLCGKIASVLTAEAEVSINNSLVKSFSCNGITVTERELEIVKLIAEGLSNKQIADKLILSTHTVNTHRKNIMSKLAVNNTAGIVMFAVKNNLLETNRFLFSN
jgi:DNA-binding NarL/FixJ family response regulator